MKEVLDGIMDVLQERISEGMEQTVNFPAHVEVVVPQIAEEILDGSRTIWTCEIRTAFRNRLWTCLFCRKY